jgi:hypothetical protein
MLNEPSGVPRSIDAALVPGVLDHEHTEETSMSKHTFHLLLVGCLATGGLWAANDTFTGKWKLNPSKSELTDQMKVEAVGEKTYALTFGADAETIVADGTDQPGLGGTTLSITVEDPHTWKVVRKKEGHTLIMATWKLSEDGTTLTDNFTGYQPNGSALRLDYVYKRTAGSSGFPGTWESSSENVNSVFEIQIQPWEGDGLSFIDAAEGVTKNIKFDGKDYPNEGQDIPPGSASSARRVNERSLQMTDKIKGKITDTQQISLSPDLRTLTMTVLLVGRRKPNVLVFERE